MIKQTWQRFWQTRAGSAAVEFALIAPVITALMVGAWEVSRAINTSTNMTNLSRTGIHYATSKYWSPETVRAAVLAEAARANLSGVSVSVQATCACSDGSAPSDCTSTNACGAGQAVKIYSEVGASQTFTSQLPLPFMGTTGSISISRSSKFRVR